MSNRAASITADPDKRTDLGLDAGSLNPESLSIPALMREISQQQRSSWILTQLMRILEQKRSSRGLGWSRAWNKTGMTTFRSHLIDWNKDKELLPVVEPFLHSVFQAVSQPGLTFATALLRDPGLMGFTFYHNRVDGAQQYEGLTLSFGRIVPGDRTKRDRLDIVLEDLRVDGRVDGRLDSIRVFACPWTVYGKDRAYHFAQIHRMNTPAAEAGQILYEDSVRCYHHWKGLPERQWSHWSSRYIDYFGARSFIPVGTSFS